MNEKKDTRELKQLEMIEVTVGSGTDALQGLGLIISMDECC